MKLKFMLLGLSVLFLNSVQAIAADEKENKDPQMSDEKLLKFCPICGPEEEMMGKEDLTYEYEGTTYRFCSQFCLDEFKKEPEKYSKVFAQDMEGSEPHEGHDHEHEDGDGHEHK